MAGQDRLLALIESVSFPEALVSDGGSVTGVTAQQLQAGIIAKFAKWLSESGVVPSKEDALAWLSNAIDMAFTAANKPALAALLKPIVKQVILSAAGNLYDQLFGGTVKA